MAINYSLSRQFKESPVNDILDSLLEKNDFYQLKNIYCGKESYNKEIQGEFITYITDYPNSRDIYIKIKSYNKIEIECKVYNHSNNIKITRRNNATSPIKEEQHIFSYDYRTDQSTSTLICRDVHRGKNNDYYDITKYHKAIFNSDGDLYSFEDEIREDKKRIEKRKFRK